jgi:hypothetical protein
MAARQRPRHYFRCRDIWIPTLIRLRIFDLPFGIYRPLTILGKDNIHLDITRVLFPKVRQRVRQITQNSDVLPGTTGSNGEQAWR